MKKLAALEIQNITTPSNPDSGFNKLYFKSDGLLYRLNSSGSELAIIGQGDVVGPSGATDNAIARYNATTGKLIQNSSVVIDDNGNIGVGTITPQRLLHIANNGSQPQILLEDNDAALGLKYGGLKFADGALQLNTMDDALNPTTRLYIAPTTGNVGIGTTNPGGKLDIISNGIGLKLTDYSGGSAYIESSDTWGQKWKFAGASANTEMNQTNTAWQFNINQTAGGLTRFRFNNNKTQYGDAVGPIMDLNINKSAIFYGDVGIDTTNPLAKTHIKGSTADNTAYGLKVDDSSNSNLFSIRNDGKVVVRNSIQIGNDTDTATSTNVGTIRYRTSGNNSYVDMCMQTGASTYEWINIVQNNW